MLIGIDANEANAAYRAGIGRYAHKVLESIYALRLKNNGAKTRFRIYLNSKPVSDMPKECGWWEYEVFGTSGLWVEKNLVPKLFAEFLRRNAPDVFWSVTHYAPIPTLIRSFVTIMDLAYLQFPKYFKKSDLIKLKLWTKLSLMQAKGVFTISEFTKKDLEKYYPFTRGKISVAYPGIDTEEFYPDLKSDKKAVNSVIKKYGIGNKYILYLGTAQPRKNLLRLVEAFSRVTKKEKDLSLVIAGMVKEGRGGWMFDEIFDLIKNLRIRDKINITGFISDRDIPYLISGSIGLVQPSLYEGFGIPVVEAMALGVPTVISRNSSLLEAGGKVAIYIENPYNIESIEQALSKLIKLKASEREKITEDGFMHSRQFSWGKAAEVIYNRLVNTE